MTTATQTLADFLLARIAEDEAVIRATIERESAPSGWLGPLRSTLEAQLAVVEEARAYSPELEHGDNGEWAFDRVLRALAAVYADHEDFRDEWRP